MCLKSIKNIGVIAHYARGVITGEIWLLQAFFEANITKILQNMVSEPISVENRFKEYGNRYHPTETF